MLFSPFSSSQSSTGSFGEEGFLSCCSSISFEPDLSEYLGHPIQRNELDHLGYSQSVEQELLVTPETVDPSFFYNSNEVVSSGLPRNNSSTSPTTVAQTPLFLRIPGIDMRDRCLINHQYSNLTLPCTQQHFLAMNVQKSCREPGHCFEEYHIPSNHSLIPAPYAAKDITTKWQDERSQSVQPEMLYSTLRSYHQPVAAAFFEEGTLQERQLLDELGKLTKCSSREDSATLWITPTEAIIPSNASVAMEDHTTTQLQADSSKPIDMLLGTQQSARDQEGTTAPHRERIVPINTTNTLSGHIEKPLVDQDIIGGRASLVQDEYVLHQNNWGCNNTSFRQRGAQLVEDSRCETTLSPGLEEALRQLRPGELHVDLLPTRLRHFAAAAQEGSTACSGSRKEKKTTKETSNVKQGFSYHVLCAKPQPQGFSLFADLDEEDPRSDSSLQPLQEARTCQEELLLHRNVVVNTPAEYDVLLGRGHRLNKHPGNIRFRSFVEQHQEEYRNTLVFEMKTSMTHMIVDMYKEPFMYKGSMVSPRFLRFHTELDSWEEVSDEVARRKVSHLLRRRIKPSKLQFCTAPSANVYIEMPPLACSGPCIST